MSALKGLFSHPGRTAMIAGAAAIALASVEPASAAAAPAAKEKGLTAATSATDFSAQRRYYRRGGGAAAAAAFAGIVGTGLAIAASRPRYYDSYGYYGGPPVTYYGGQGYYYGGNPYYYNSPPQYGGYTTGEYW